MKAILITICGRAGSKGVKNKNIRDFLGHPLVQYTIDQAKVFKKNCEKYEIDIAVNSDSEKLLNIAKQNGCTIVNRKEENATDSAAKVPVIIDTVQKMEQQTGKRYLYVLDLDITSPLRTLKDIQNGLKKIETEQYDCVFSVVPARRNPYFNMIEEKNGKAKKVIESDFVSRQQAPPVYDMNASIYFYRRDALGSRIKTMPFDGEFSFFVMRDYGVIDIDSERDFDLMAIIYENFFQKSKGVMI